MNTVLGCIRRAYLRPCLGWVRLTSGPLRALLSLVSLVVPLARVPVADRFGGRRYVTTRVDVDEPTLQQTAETTGGRYYRATDRESLEAIYAEIDELERTEIEVENFTQFEERFPIPLGLGFLLLMTELALAQTVLRRLP